MKPELVQNGDDIEALAAKAREAREKKCSEDVIDILEANNCQVVAMVQIGGQRVPVEAILRIPVEVGVEARRK